MTAPRHGSRPRQKKVVEADVWESALARVHRAYDLFDNVAVSFSGGKDSTVTLHAVLEVANELHRDPVKVYFNDEECIPYETVEYVERVAKRDDVEMIWACLPFKLRNACSKKHPDWWTWAPEDKARWARPLPKGPWVVTELEGVTDVPRDQRPEWVTGFQNFIDPMNGSLGICLGIRAQESMTRFRNVTNKSVDNYINSFGKEGDRWGVINKVMPVYDWTTEDVWTAPAVFGWDYNRAYDIFEMAGVAHNQQRCSPAFGEEPLGGLHQFATCFPEVWEHMQERVPGVGSAYRYARTSLYGFGGTQAKPPGMKWSEFIVEMLGKHSVANRAASAERIRGLIKHHYEVTRGAPIAPYTAHPDSGISWRFITNQATRVDTKNRRLPLKEEKNRAPYHEEIRALTDLGLLKEATEW